MGREGWGKMVVRTNLMATLWELSKFVPVKELNGHVHGR